jgi:hypothetical protein
MIRIYENGEFVPLEGKTLYGHTFKKTDRIYTENCWFMCSDLSFDRSLFPTSITISGATPTFLNGVYTIPFPEYEEPSYWRDITGQYEEFSQYRSIRCDVSYANDWGFWVIGVVGWISGSDAFVDLLRLYCYTEYDFLTNENPIWYRKENGEPLDFTVTKNY